MSLRKYAIEVFLSLRNNPIHAEFELSQWHQAYFNYDKRRMQSNVRTSSNAQGSSSRIVTLEPEMEAKQCRRTGKHGKHRTRRGTKDYQNAAFVNIKIDFAAIPKEDDNPQFQAEHGRNSYITMFVHEPKTIAYNTDSVSYVESIEHFVRSAGSVAKNVANRKCTGYLRSKQAQTTYEPSPFGNPSTISPQPACAENLNTSASKNCESSIAYGEFEFKSCNLHTDELLRSFTGNLGSSSNQEAELKQDTFLIGSTSNSTNPNILPNLNLIPKMQSPPGNHS